MSAAASGRQRHDRNAQRVAELRAQAHELLRRADALEGVNAAVAKGNDGELVVGRTLESLGPGWVVLHDRRKSPRSPANLDHIVVGPPGVCVVDAKNWAPAPLVVDGRGIRVGGWRRDEELQQVRQDAALVGSACRSVVPRAGALGVLAFVHDMDLPSPRRDHGVLLARHDAIPAWLAQQPRVLADADVVLLAQELDLRFPPRCTPPSARRSVRRRPVGTPRGGSVPSRRPTGRRRSERRPNVPARSKLVGVALVLLVLLLAPGLVPAVLNGVAQVVAGVATSAVSDIGPPPG